MSGIDSNLDLSGPEARLLTRLLDAASLRQRVIASNLANATTPGYRRLDVRFDDLLARALKGGGNGEDVKPEVVRTDEPVQLEAELGRLTRNSLLYETYAAVLGGKLALLRAAITGRNG